MKTPPQVATTFSLVPVGGVFFYNNAYYEKVDAADAFNLTVAQLQAAFTGIEAVVYYPNAELALS